MSVAEKKLSLLERIMRLPYNHQWEKLESIVSKIEEDVQEETPEELLARFAEPLTETIDIEELEKEQNFPKYDSKKALELVKEMNIQEPIEDLLNMI